MDPSAGPPAGNGTSSGAHAASHVPSMISTSSTMSAGSGGGQLPERSPSRSSTRHSASASHRQSFVENLRNPPPSPRSLRVPSLSQQAIQDLLNHPPPQRQPHPRFAGRDWQDITLGELILENEIRWAEMDTSVEDCTKVLLRSGSTGVVLLRNKASDKTAVASFDHQDLNAYLLAVVGLAKPEPEDMAVYRNIVHRAQQHMAIPVRDIQPICHKDPITTMPLTEHLPRAIELFGSGVHRILVTSPTSSDVLGIVNQLRLLEFFWNEGVNFPMIDRLYPVTLRELRVGSQEIIAINGDRPLSEALSLMNNMGLTSVAVVDNGQNVMGNISTTDVEHLTSVTSFPLLQSSCIHFISVILSERGVEEGRDSFPVFHVNAHSTLAHTVAKLVATRSHRMWVVDTASPSPSAPHTPQLAPVSSGSVSSISLVSSSSRNVETASNNGNNTGNGGATSSSANTASHRNSVILMPDSSMESSAPQSPIPIPQGASNGGGSNNNNHAFSAVPAAALPGSHLSGRLSGVVSLTDVLNLFAKTSGLQPSDLAEVRARRRRSSSTSSSLRPSIDGARPSLDLLRR